MAAFSDKINKSIKEAMIAKDKVRLATLRDIKSKLILEATSGNGSEVSDEIAIKICMKLYKQRKETHQLYIEQNREDLASEELAQASIIEEFLPKMLSEQEIQVEVSAAIKALNAGNMSDMGKVMGFLSTKLAGKADGKVISTMVRQGLSN
ncbi:GatB/YqeY domain-containing protein [Crocinitomicaceae bacterium]|nr:GatB/YqeY domain-containing protein [Crocinitomicaceae bacterium]